MLTITKRKSLSNNNQVVILLKNNQEQQDSGTIFLNKIFRNIVLNRQIFKQLNLLKFHENYKFKTLDEFNNHKYKEYISEILFIDGFNEEFELLSNNLIINKIEFGNKFNNNNFKSLNSFQSITSLNFGNLFNKEITNEMLPINCKSLILGDSFNFQLLENCKSLPINLEYLKIGNSFSKELTITSLPRNLKVLIIGDSFKQKFIPKLLPESLIELEVGIGWDQALNEQSFPRSIEKLKFKHFNHPICQGYLPSGLKELKFGFKFNQKLSKGSIPEGLRVLELGYHYAQLIDEGVLPQSLISLDVGRSFYYSLDKVGILPNSLESIKFSPCSFQSILFPNKNLKSISIGYYFKNLHLIPKTVTTIELDKIIPGIPNHIKNLKLSSDFNNLSSVSVENIPKSIESLDTGNAFNQPLRYGILPNSVTSLHLGNSFNHPIEKGVLSNTNINHLSISSTSFQYQLTNENLPIHLKSLTLSKYYNKNNLKNISNLIKLNFI